MKKDARTEASIALIGNPNVGKSTIFNALTGAHQHTGNWPGKTVAVARGHCQGTAYTLVDLPGTYSLLSRSEEETIAVEFVQSGQAACTVVVCDATCLERTLSLALQMMELTDRIVVCVNLLDEAQKQSIAIDLPKLARLLGVPVVGTSAGKTEGLERLRQTMQDVAEGKTIPKPLRILQNQGLHGRTEAESDQIAMALRLRAKQLVESCASGIAQTAPHSKLDAIVLHPIWGKAVMAALLLMVFWLTIEGANVPSRWLQSGFDALGSFLQKACAWLPELWRSVLLDGVYATAARVVAVMLPPMAIFFPLFTILEDFGYLPRAAFLLDRPFCRCGACGKQALTTCMGFGCNAVGVTGCRIIDSPRERLLAIATNAFVPCNGRFPTLILLITVFFAGKTATILAAGMLTLFVMLAVGMSMAATKLLHKTVLKGEMSSFAMELPPYRRPNIGRILWRSVCDRTLFVLGRAVMVAAPAGAMIWLLANVNCQGQSILLWISNFLQPLGQIMGMNGAILAAFLLGIPANELVLPVLCMILSASGTLSQLGNADIGAILLANGWTWQTALCVMTLCLFHAPCATTILTIKKETGSTKWTLISIALPTAVGMILCLLLHTIFAL